MLETILDFISQMVYNFLFITDYLDTNNL